MISRGRSLGPSSTSSCRRTATAQGHLALRAIAPLSDKTQQKDVDPLPKIAVRKAFVPSQGERESERERLRKRVCFTSDVVCTRHLGRSFISILQYTHTHFLSSLLAQIYPSHKSHICIRVHMYRYMQSAAEACSDQRPFAAIRTNKLYFVQSLWKFSCCELKHIPVC